MTPDEITAAIDRLASADLRERDLASAQLAGGGWAAGLRLVHGSHQLAPRARARALFTFVAVTYAEQTRRVHLKADPRSLNLHGRLGELGPTLHHQLDLAVRVAAPLQDLHLDLEHACSCALEALDTLAAAVGGRWEQDAFGDVDLVPGPEPTYPTAYDVDIRLRIVDATTVHYSDFVTRTTSASYVLELCVERPLQPLRPLVIHAVHARGEAGERPEVKLTPRERGDHRTVHHLELTAIPQTMRRFAELRFSVHAQYPETHEIVEFTQIIAGASRPATLCTFEIHSVSSGGLRLVTRAAPDVAEMLARLVDAAFLAISDDDEELASVSSFRPAGPPEVVSWHLRWRRITTDRITALRIRVAASLVTCVHTLTLHDVPLA